MATKPSIPALVTPFQKPFPRGPGLTHKPSAEQTSGKRNGVAFSHYRLKITEQVGSDFSKMADEEARGPSVPTETANRQPQTD